MDRKVQINVIEDVDIDDTDTDIITDATIIEDIHTKEEVQMEEACEEEA